MLTPRVQGGVKGRAQKGQTLVMSNSERRLTICWQTDGIVVDAWKIPSGRRPERQILGASIRSAATRTPDASMVSAQVDAFGARIGRSRG